MTTELTKAAQQALEAFDAFADADDFPTCFELTKKMNALRHALTQRPAAQTEREAFEHTMSKRYGWVPKDFKRDDFGYFDGHANTAWAAWQARASLPAAQATPEPVGEVVARVELMQTGGNAGLATRIVEIDDPLRERLRPGDLLFTRPATGVPEGFVHLVANKIESVRAANPGRNGRPNQAVSFAIGLLEDLLAAAQAKHSPTKDQPTAEKGNHD